MAGLSRIGFLGWGGIVAAGAVVGALAVGALFQGLQSPAPDSGPAALVSPEGDAPGPDAPADAVRAAPGTPAAVAEPPGSPPAVGAVAPATPAPPGFDVVRIAEDGGALVAGSALPGAAITLRVDGVEAAQAAADAAGQFVAMFLLAPSDAVQLMTLEMMLADGQVIASPDSVVLTPRPAEPPAGAEQPQLAALEAPPADHRAPPRLGAAPPGEQAPRMPPSVTVPLGAVATGDAAETAPQLVLRPLADAPADAPALRPLASVQDQSDLPVRPPDAGALLSPAQPPEPPTDPSRPAMADMAGTADPEPVAVARAETDQPRQVETALPGSPLPRLPVPETPPLSVTAGETTAPTSPATAPERAPTPEAMSPPDDPSGAPPPQVATALPAPAPLQPETEDHAMPALGASGRPESRAIVAPVVAPDALPPQPAGGPSVDAAARLVARPPASDPLPRAFLLRGTGEVELIDRAPQVMDNVVIDMIGYSAEGDVRISGRAARAEPDGALRIYLDNRPVALAQAEGGDWRLDLPEVDPGVYTLRVDQLDDGGRVISRFETPFLREAPERVALAQQALASPPAQAEADSADVPRVPPPPPPSSGTSPAIPPEMAPAAVSDTEPEPIPGAITRSPQPAAPQSGEPRPARPAITLVTVQPGQSLWRISDAHYGDGVRWVQIYRANRDQIRNPDLIYPGQVFTVPE